MVKTEIPTQWQKATVPFRVSEMGLTTSFIEEQSMPMRYCEFVVGSGVIFRFREVVDGPAYK